MYPLSGSSSIMNGDETLEFTRYPTPTYIDGKPVQGTPDTFDVICNRQPLSPRDLLVVPEGDRDKEQYWIFSENLDEQIALQDETLIDRVNFVVMGIEPWGSYSRARIVKIDVGADRTT